MLQMLTIIMSGVDVMTSAFAQRAATCYCGPLIWAACTQLVVGFC
jgi:hypothetical protein